MEFQAREQGLIVDVVEAPAGADMSNDSREVRGCTGRRLHARPLYPIGGVQPVQPCGATVSARLDKGNDVWQMA